MPAHFWCPLNIWNVTDWGLLKFLLSCDNYTEHYNNDTFSPLSRSQCHEVHRASQNIILKYLRASVPCKLGDNLSTVLLSICMRLWPLFDISSYGMIWRSLSFCLWECHSCPGSPLARASNANNKLLIVFQLGSHHQECPDPVAVGIWKPGR